MVLFQTHTYDLIKLIFITITFLFTLFNCRVIIIRLFDIQLPKPDIMV